MGSVHGSSGGPARTRGTRQASTTTTRKTGAATTSTVGRRSTRSGGNGGDCADVATNLPGVVAVLRFEGGPDGSVLTFTPNSSANDGQHAALPVDIVAVTTMAVDE